MLSRLAAALRSLTLPWGAQPGTPHLVFGAAADFPANLSSAYTGSEVVGGVVLFGQAPGDYTYLIQVQPFGVAVPVLCCGSASGTAVRESWRVRLSIGTPGNPTIPEIFFNELVGGATDLGRTWAGGEWRVTSGPWIETGVDHLIDQQPPPATTPGPGKLRLVNSLLQVNVAGNPVVEGGKNDVSIHGDHLSARAESTQLGAAGATSSGLWTPSPGPLNVAFRKVYASTRLKITYTAGSFTNTANTGADFGVNIPALGDIGPVARMRHATAFAYGTAAGVLFVSGVPALNFTVQGRWRQYTGGAATIQMDGDGLSSLTVEEVS